MRGQPDTPTPPHIVEAAHASLRDGRTGYPDNQGEPALRRAVAEKLRREQGLTYDPDREILITDGATLRHLCRPGRAGASRTTTCCCPTRSMTPMPRRSRSGADEPTPVPSRVRDGRFTIDRAELRERLGQP